VAEDVSFIERLLKYWDERGVPYLKGNSPRAIRAVERRTGIVLPEQLRAFYSATNGLRVPGSSGADDRLFDFWPLKEVCRVAHDPTLVFFVDVSQAAWEFAIEAEGSDKRSKGAVCVVTESPVEIAPSFAEFIDRYIANDPSLYPGHWYHPEGPR
jgi:hypothetical protein